MCVIKVCLNGDATYIISKIIAKIQFEHGKFNANIQKSSSPKLLNRILWYYTQIVLD